jgi:hypothetical protein
VSKLKKAGFIVVEYVEGDRLKVLNQRGAELLSTLITEGFIQSLMWSSPTEPLIAKGSSQSLERLSTTRILSHYMTLLLVQNHERVRYGRVHLKPRRTFAACGLEEPFFQLFCCVSFWF